MTQTLTCLDLKRFWKPGLGGQWKLVLEVDEGEDAEFLQKSLAKMKRSLPTPSSHLVGAEEASASWALPPLCSREQLGQEPSGLLTDHGRRHTAAPPGFVGSLAQIGELTKRDAACD